VRIILLLLVLVAFQGEPVAVSATTELIAISADSPRTALPHFWEQMFGSGRAILSLRESYREDLRSVKAVTELRYVRFHNILHDEVGLYSRDARGQPHYNFSYIDQIYDGLLENGARPFVEISFMPLALSSNPKSTMSFWYRPNRAPPRSYAEWDDLVRQFVAHLVKRYGIEEVSKWYFEVWNEPNIDFWDGKPKQRTYFELYVHTARDIKSVGRELRVGGPATAQAAWVGDFIRFTQRARAPVDFISSHVYGNDTAKNVLGTRELVPRDRMVCRAAQKVHDEISRSAQPQLPFILSEFNASYANEPDVTDSIYMGPWLASTIRQCAGIVDLMSYWTFSDVFEEQGVVKSPFYGGYGLLAEHGIAKPAFNAFALLHKLGEQRISVNCDSALVTKRADGTLVMALWNYAEPETGARTPPAQSASLTAVQPDLKQFTLRIDGIAADAAFTAWRLDIDHGNVIKTFDDMGRPAFPTRQQIETLRAAAELPAPESGALKAGVLEVAVPPHGLVVIEVTSQRPNSSKRN
jgi:xylan 1,4-beta-xylosidase